MRTVERIKRERQSAAKHVKTNGAAPPPSRFRLIGFDELKPGKEQLYRSISSSASYRALA